MHKFMNLLDIDLRLFDGTAGEGAAPAGDGAAQDIAGALPKAETGRRGGRSRRSESGDLTGVVYGKQAAATAAAETDANPSPHAADGGSGEGNTESTEAKRPTFEELISGEYKDDFTARTQQIIDRRFKETKGLEKSLLAQQPVMELLMQRYQIADGDVGKLMQALQEDTRIDEDNAEREGLTIEQYRTKVRLEKENAQLRQMQERINAQRRRGQQMQQAQTQLNKWYAEADQVKQIYPGFDFKAEAANRDFLGLLKAGISVRQAYETMHLQEITTARAESAAKVAEEQTLAKVQRHAARPAENGTSTKSAAIVKKDVSKLTKKDREEIARRAARGVHITF